VFGFVCRSDEWASDKLCLSAGGACLQLVLFFRWWVCAGQSSSSQHLACCLLLHRSWSARRARNLRSAGGVQSRSFAKGRSSGLATYLLQRCGVVIEAGIYTYVSFIVSWPALSKIKTRRPRRRAGSDHIVALVPALNPTTFLPRQTDILKPQCHPNSLERYGTYLPRTTRVFRSYLDLARGHP
jgi:hypothetical protein